MLSDAGSFCIPTSHPCLPGHFPGRPVVPGVVLLDEAYALVCLAEPRLPPLRGFSAVKFMRPIFPGQYVSVQWEQTAPGRLAFILRVEGLAAVRGTALMAMP
ncbi:MAG: hypothetical protein JOZ58_11885 [Acetobacteraceae bacterium]|nr:hypothetical protein [Acetobacteraceae bacterium]